MKILISIVTMSFFFGQFVFADFNQAESLMKKSDCLACHSKTQKIVGPSFEEISKKYKNEKNASTQLTQSVIKGSQGKWGAIPMPPHPTLNEKDAQTMIEGILSLANTEENSKKKEKNEPEASTFDPTTVTQVDIEKGQFYFEGRLRFQNRGPSCIACHHVKNDAVIGGGILAKDLTSVFSRLGGRGVQAILGQPPFAVMEQAYLDHPLTPDEIYALVAFLNDADQKHLYQTPKDYGAGLVLSGVFGAIVLMVFFLFIGARRKRFSVNQDIFKRQIKSQ